MTNVPRIYSAVVRRRCPLDIHLEGFFSSRRDNPRSYEITFMQKMSAEADWSKVSACGGGCLLDGMTDAGDMLVPDERVCNFHLNIGAAAVAEVVDNAIRNYLN